MNEEHYKLIKANISNGSSDDNNRKKRGSKRFLENDIELTNLEASEDSESFDSEEFEDIDLEHDDSIAPDNYANILSAPVESGKEPDVVTVTINKSIKDSRRTNKTKIISKESRHQRYLIHKMYIVLMTIHGAIRNRWCNDYKSMVELKKIVPSYIIDLLRPDNDSKVKTSILKSRNFIDGVRKLMLLYSGKFSVSKQGLIRKSWNELCTPQNGIERNVTFEKFQRLLHKMKGSRDIGAQGFVCLCRALDLNTRLVFSLQPPDYTLISEMPKIDLSTSAPTKKTTAKKRKPNFGNSNKASFLASLREKRMIVNDENEAPKGFPNSNFPIFWVEVWDKFSKKWISIDPIVMRFLEIVPLRRKSKFEPPLSDATNQVTYVIAYDKFGGVRDVTRRYSTQYNAKVYKKRIEFKAEEEKIWYQKVILSCQPNFAKTRNRKINVLEMKEFHDRDLNEGMPNSLSDFKNHPFYAIESQLAQNQVIYPKDDISRCGYFKSKSSRSNSAPLLAVYKRSYVHTLRSATAWYMNGRVLKVGEHPLKIIKRSNSIREDENDNEMQIDDSPDGRLYAEFQTKLFLPPPAKDGIIPKNAYGNIDAYVPTMIPANCSLLRSDAKCTLKILESSAKLLGIDYAKAIVGFDFNSQKKRLRAKAQARVGGIVVCSEYIEAMKLAIESFMFEEENNINQKIRFRALNAWKYLFAKLKIARRLNNEHGILEKAAVPYYEQNHREIRQLDEEKTEAHEILELNNSQDGSDSFAQAGEGGFILQDSEYNEATDDFNDNIGHGGFLIEEEYVEGCDDPDSENTKQISLHDSRVHEIKTSPEDKDIERKPDIESSSISSTFEELQDCLLDKDVVVLDSSLNSNAITDREEETKNIEARTWKHDGFETGQKSNSDLSESFEELAGKESDEHYNSLSSPNSVASTNFSVDCEVPNDILSDFEYSD